MGTENHGLTSPQPRRLQLAADNGGDLAILRNGTLTRLRHGCTQPGDPDPQTVRGHLERVFRSAHFDGSTRSREFLRYVVEEVLAGRAAYLKQAAIAVEVFGRQPDFDAVIDPIVRVQAGRLRRSLERYYLLSGDVDSIRIELPKGSYAPVFVTSAELRQPRLTSELAQDWPTLVALPFMVHSPRDEAAASQLRDELGAELCRYGIVRVMAATEGQSPAHAARFELHGVAREMVGGLQFTARLVDRSSGQQVWSDEFQVQDRPGSGFRHYNDIGRVIAARIGSEHGAIARLIAGEQAARAFPSRDGFSALARAQHFMFSRQLGALLPAIEGLQEMTRRTPEVELAWTSLARLYLMNHSFELSNLFTPVEMAIGCANQSVLLEPASARTRCLMATVLLVKGELGAARRELELALRLNIDSLAYRESIGWLLALTGEWEAGVELMRSARDRNPYCLPCVSHGLWADAMRRGDFEAAYASALDYREPNFFWRELMITSCLGRLRRTEDARASAMELLRAKPQFATQGRRLIAHYIKEDALRDSIVEGLGRAGVKVI
jgi:adenylate cyclase